MSDDLDVLGLLRKYEHMDKLKKQAADEIERLRVALALACGELSTTDHHRNQHPEPLMKQFLNEARRG